MADATIVRCSALVFGPDGQVPRWFGEAGGPTRTMCCRAGHRARVSLSGRAPAGRCVRRRGWR
jgi:hypothetical protein